MGLRSAGIQRWWPSTQSLDLVDGPVENVAIALAELVQRFVRTSRDHDADFDGVSPSAPALSAEGSPVTEWRTFTGFEAALESLSEFASFPTTFLAFPTRSNWTVLWNNSSHCNGYDSLCHCLTEAYGMRTISWSANDAVTTSQPGAQFCCRQRRDGNVVLRSVNAHFEGPRWRFYETGATLPEEDVAGYSARKIRDRLNEGRVASLLARLGAEPWQEAFYALPEKRVFVVRRTLPKDAVKALHWSDVLRAG
jgi:hypothetical protein